MQEMQVAGRVRMDGAGGAWMHLKPVLRGRGGGAQGAGPRRQPTSLDIAASSSACRSPPSPAEVIHMMRSGEFEVDPSKLDATSKQICGQIGAIQRNVPNIMQYGQGGQWNEDAHARLIKWFTSRKRPKRGARDLADLPADRGHPNSAFR